MMDLQLQQSGTQVNGYFTVGPPLQCNGQVQGIISGNVLHLEQSMPSGTIILETVIQGDHMEGDYVVQSPYSAPREGVINLDKMY